MSIASILADLENRHRELESRIAFEAAQPSHDEIAIRELKRRKLSIRDEIERLRRQGLPGAAADTMAFFPADLPAEQMVAGLRAVASADHASLRSAQTSVVAEVKSFLEWLDDPRPEVAFGQPDKFAEIIELSRRYERCSKYYLSDVGVNVSTVWRWATGNSRPSRFVGQRIVPEVKIMVVEALWELCARHHLIRAAAADQALRPAQPA